MEISEVFNWTMLWLSYGSFNEEEHYILWEILTVGFFIIKLLNYPGIAFFYLLSSRLQVTINFRSETQLLPSLKCLFVQIKGKYPPKNYHFFVQ